MEMRLILNPKPGPPRALPLDLCSKNQPALLFRGRVLPLRKISSILEDPGKMVTEFLRLTDKKIRAGFFFLLDRK
jgi:hypothetical protein